MLAKKKHKAVSSHFSAKGFRSAKGIRSDKCFTKLYFCEHCKEHLSYKTYCRHSKLYLKKEKPSITVDLPSFTDDSEEGIPYIIIAS